jgi:hypothetical protein
LPGLRSLWTLIAALGALIALAAVVGCGPGPKATQVAASGGPPCSGTKSAAAPAAAGGWRSLADFPTQGAAQVSSIVGLPNCFVAVGSTFDPDAPCLDDEFQGLLWTSADGIAWTAQSAEAFAKTRMTQLFTFGDSLYAVGVTSEGDTTQGCSVAPDQPGLNFWRSSDNAASWQRLAQSAALANTSIGQVIVVGDSLMAVGSRQGTDIDEAMTWTSPDAAIWTAAEQPPNAPGLSIAAARDKVVVAFGEDQDYPLAWITRDVGANWYEESIDVDGAPPDGLTTAVESVVATAAGFVAVGDGCCVGTAQLVPIVFASDDGTQWIGHIQPADHTEAMRRVVAIPTGLLAVGVETYVNDPVDTSRLGGRSWISTDGAAWRRGPDFAELGDGNVSAVAAGPGGVVVAGTDEATGLHVWFAPYGAFEVGASN